MVAPAARLLPGDHRLQRRGPNGFIPYGTLAGGIPGAPNPDIQSGNILLPRGVDMRSPDVDNVKRGTIDSWNVFVERRLPMDLSLSAGYVGTATRDGYADINLNYAESGGNAQRQYFAQAGNADDPRLGGSFALANYHSLQMALNRPFKNGLLLKGAYTLSKALNQVDDDGRAVRDVEPAVAVRPQLRLCRLRPSAHAAARLRLRAAVRARGVGRARRC